MWADNCKKIDKIWPLAISNQISMIWMHIPSLMKIHWSLLKFPSENENTDSEMKIRMSWTDNSGKNWWNLPINNTKLDLHNSNAHTKFDENPWAFTQVNILKQKYRQTYDRRAKSIDIYSS